jgi:hypothetical protein
VHVQVHMQRPDNACKEAVGLHLPLNRATPQELSAYESGGVGTDRNQSTPPFSMSCTDLVWLNDVFLSLSLASAIGLHEYWLWVCLVGCKQGGLLQGKEQRCFRNS